jgi:hypothetical protein
LCQRVEHQAATRDVIENENELSVRIARDVEDLPASLHTLDAKREARYGLSARIDQRPTHNANLDAFENHVDRIVASFDHDRVEDPVAITGLRVNPQTVIVGGGDILDFEVSLRIGSTVVT